MGVKYLFPSVPIFKDVGEVQRYLTSFHRLLSAYENLLSKHKHAGVLNDFDVVTTGGYSFTNTATGLTWTSGSSTLSLTAGYVIPTTTEQTNWNAAYSASHARSHTLLSTSDHSDIGTYINQALLTSSSPTFSNLTDSGLTSGRVPYVSTGGLLVDSSKFIYDGYNLTLIGENNIVATRVSTYGSGAYPQYGFYHARGTIASPLASEDTDLLADIIMQGRNYDNTGWVVGARIQARVSGTPSGTYAMPTSLDLMTSLSGNTCISRLWIGANGNIVINEDGLSTADVRMEGDTDANLFFLDASADFIGIGKNNPGVKLDVSGQINCTNLLDSVLTSGRIPYITTGGLFTDTANLLFNGTTMTVVNFIANESGADRDCRIEGDTDQNLLFTDGGTDRVGIGTGTPVEKLEVAGNVDIDNYELKHFRVHNVNNPIPASWTQTTNMGSLPSADGWNYAGTAPEASFASVAGGILTIDTTGGTTEKCYYNIENPFTNATGYTVEFKLQVVTCAAYDTRLEVELYDNLYRQRFQFDTTSIQLTLGTATSYSLDTTVYHTYRITVIGTVCKVYIDGVLRITNTLSSSSGGANHIYFGDNNATSGSNSKSYWDYINYNDTGAFEALPLSGGQMFYNSATGKLNFYNALTSAWEVVTSA